MTSGIIKKSLYWIGGLAALLVAIASLVLSFLDWNQYRTTLSDLATNQMDMRVELGGDVSVALFPRPSVSVEAVRIAPLGQESSDVVGTADKISIRLGIEGFLRGDLVIQSLVLEGLNVALDEAVDGSWHVRGWPVDEAVNEARTAIAFSRLEVENGQVTLLPLEGEQQTIEQLNLFFSGALPKGPLEWRGDFNFKGLAIETAGQLKPVKVRDELSVKTDITVGEEQVTLSGRLADNGDATARLVINGASLSTMAEAVKAVSGYTDAAVSVPDLSYSLDLQIDVSGGIAKFVSRQLMIGQTRGRADITLARKSQLNHVAGSLSLGVIDVEEWRAAMPADAKATVSEHRQDVVGSGARFPFSGAVDVTIEGVQMKGGLGQRMDAVVALRSTGPEITSLQALLPGATSVFLRGDMGLETGQGVARLEVGNIADLAEWIGVELPSALPAGRLTTAKLSGTLAYQDKSWSLSALEGNLDTSALNGEMSGRRGEFIPSHVRLGVDTLDLVMFASDQQTKNKPVVLVPEAMDIAFDVSVDSLQGFNASLGNGRFVGSLGPGRLEVESLTLEKDSGSLKIEGVLANSQDDVTVELAASFLDWPMLISRHYIPELHSYLVAANMEKISGTASAVGIFSKMRLGLHASSNEQDITLSGEIGFPENKLTFANLQGGVAHKNLAAIARLAGLGDYKALPAELTYSLTKSGPGTPLETKFGGELAGGKIQAELHHQNRIGYVAVSYDHENVGLLETSLGRQFLGLDPSERIRAEMLLNRGEGGGWLIDLPSVSNGNRSLSGSVQIAEDNGVFGSLNVRGLTLLENQSAGAADFDELLQGNIQSLADYAGVLQVTFNDTMIAGQMLEAPKASFSVSDGAAHFVLGEGAKLNGRPTELEIDATLNGALPFSARTHVEGFDLAALLGSMGGSDVISSSLQGSLALTGELANSEGVLESLKGSGDFNGSAGQLKFLSVGGLLEQVNTARSGRSFLSLIGNVLRKGETPFGTLSSRFTVDGGVVLLENLEAVGDWGTLSLDGQVNLKDRFLSLRGDLALTNPPDIPVVPVNYSGPFDGPTANWSSRALERFVVASIERRLRAQLYQEFEQRQVATGTVPQNPGLAVFARAAGLLTQLKRKQEEVRKQAEEAAKAESLTPNDALMPLETEGQKP